KSGPLTVRDMYSLYIYENTLFAISVTGQQIKDELEWSANYFNTYTYSKTATSLINSNVPGYNYDMLQGADYVIDTTKPVGQRISGLIYHGKPMDMTATYTLALNNYRAGGGGFLGFKGSPIVYQSSEYICDLMIQYVKDAGTIDPTVDNNWQLVPDYLDSQYRTAIDTLNRQSALSEFPAGAFAPDSTATRGDLAAIITGSYTSIGSRNHGSSFVDVASDSWYARAVGTVEALKLMNGTSARTFAPDAPVTTEQAVVTLMRASGYGAEAAKYSTKPGVNPTTSWWALPYVSFAESKGLITAEQATAPKHQLTRGELVDMIVKMRFPTVVILHTNDFHGNLVPVIDANKNSVAGAAREATIINSVRSTFGEDHVLLVDAGDAIQGATVANLFQGKSVIDAYNAMGYNVATLGNHEWDYGQEVLKERIADAKFDYVNSNLTGTNLGWKSSVIKNISGINIGLFGLMTSDYPIIVTPSSQTNVTVEDPIASAKTEVADLKAQGAQYVIALSHCGFENGGAPLDPAIAAGAPGINLIIGGHSHTVLKTAVMVGKTMITQTGTAGAYVGKEVIDFTMYQGKVSRQSVSYELVPTVTSIPEDPAVKAIVDGYNNQLTAKLSVVIGKALVALDGERADVRTKETNLGNYVADWMRISTGADIAFMGGGSIRISVPAGDVTVGNIYAVLPFDNFLEVLEIKGSTLKAALENSVSAYPAQLGGFLQVSGFSFSFDPSKPAGSRVVSITRDGKPVDMDATYKLAVQDYNAIGGDGYTMLIGAKIVYKSSEWNRDGMVTYIMAHPEINPTVEGRITVVKP
ncbi:MAG TPA: 5'-nucleotidase C-terminal domain-containing protein, partial [Candidatus Cryosericum sp.]